MLTDLVHKNLQWFSAYWTNEWTIFLYCLPQDTRRFTLANRVFYNYCSIYNSKNPQFLQMFPFSICGPPWPVWISSVSCQLTSPHSTPLRFHCKLCQQLLVSHPRPIQGWSFIAHHADLPFRWIIFLCMTCLVDEKCKSLELSWRISLKVKKSGKPFFFLGYSLEKTYVRDENYFASLSLLYFWIILA